LTISKKIEDQIDQWV